MENQVDYEMAGDERLLQSGAQERLPPHLPQLPTPVLELVCGTEDCNGKVGRAASLKTLPNTGAPAALFQGAQDRMEAKMGTEASFAAFLFSCPSFGALKPPGC